MTVRLNLGNFVLFIYFLEESSDVKKGQFSDAFNDFIEGLAINSQSKSMTSLDQHI